MPVTRMSVTIAAAALLLAATSDRLAPTHTAHARAGSGDAPAGLPKFTLFGWVSPPASLADSSRYAEMAAAGLNLALPALDDTGGLADAAREQLDLAASGGLRVLVWDERFSQVVEPGIDRDSLLDAITGDFRDHSALAGYYLGDEPVRSLFPLLSEVHAALRARDSAHPGWNNLLGRGAFPSASELETHLRAYAETVAPAVLCNAVYDFTPSGDRNHFVENLSVLAALAREQGIPFWSIVQLVQHQGYRALTPGELRWQVSHLLAYGARGVGYFTYWTPPPDPYWNWQPAVIGYDGQRTAWYDVLAAFNPYVREAGETLADLAWIATEHAGSVPPGGHAFVADDWVSAVEGRAAIGQFADANGGRMLVLVNSDSLAARTIAVTVPDADSIEWLAGAPIAWQPAPATPASGGLRVEVPLEAGSLRLLRVHGAAAGSGASGARPGLEVSPNPARGTCRFAIAAAVSGATLEIIDAGGRRVWARTLPPGRSTVQWNGETAAGARAPRGLYFARIRDDRGAAVQRLTWLGSD